MLAFISVAINFLFCDKPMFEVLLCCNSFPVLIMSYFSDPYHKRILIKGMQAIKMCSCSCIIIQPCALQSTSSSLGVLCSHYWSATFHKSNQTSIFFSTPKSVVTEMHDTVNEYRYHPKTSLCKILAFILNNNFTTTTRLNH